MNLDKYITEQITPYINKDVMEFMKERGGWIAGGALTSILSREPINDIDIYLHTKQDIHDFILKFGESQVLLHYSGKSCSFSVSGSIGRKSLPYHQLITLQPYNCAEDIFAHFDFTINMVAFHPKSGAVTIHPLTMQHIAQRYLSFNKDTLFPFISMMRVDKYKDRGYKATKPTIMKIAMACSKKVMNSWEDFREQLGGLYGEELDLDTYSDKEFSYDVAMEFLSGSYRVFKQNEKPLSAYNVHLQLLAIVQSRLMPEAILTKSKKHLIIFHGRTLVVPISEEEEGCYIKHQDINSISLEDVALQEGSFKEKYCDQYLYTGIKDFKTTFQSRYRTSLPSSEVISAISWEEDDLRWDSLGRWEEERTIYVQGIFQHNLCDQEIEHIKEGVFLPGIAYAEYPQYRET